MSVSGQLQKLQEIDLADLDFQRVALWPAAARGGVFFILALILVLLGWWFHLEGKQAQYRQLQAQEVSLKQAYQEQMLQMAGLAALHKEQDTLKARFEGLLGRLPPSLETPDLIDEITAAGNATALEFLSIEMGETSTGDFYTQVPIHIKVRGAYHDFGAFFALLADNARPMTLHDFNIQPADSSGRLLNLRMDIKTYSRLDQSKREAP